MSVGLLILRLVVGGILVAHGGQKLFGWFGGHGLAGTGQFFERDLHLPSGRNYALGAGLGELLGGSLLILGFVTPGASAAAVGVMIVAMVAVHWRNGFFNTAGGIEFPLLVATAAAVLAFTGAGRYSLDHAVGWDLDGWGWGVAAIGWGIGGAISVLLSRRDPAQCRERESTRETTSV